MTRPAHVALDEAATAFGALAERDVALAPLTTYRLGGPARLLVRPQSLDDLRRVAEILGATDVPALVIGRGSNLLVADTGFAGVVVVTSGLADEFGFPELVAGATPAEVVVGGGLALPIVARRLAAAGLRGFEWAVGVPGSVGGAVRMNAGGHGSDIASCLIDATVFDLRRGTVQTRTADELAFRFRSSALTDDELVLSARISVEPGDAVAASALVDEIVAWRRRHQPGGQNAGSVFVNPIPGALSAGLLVDRVGLRGHSVGTAQVSPKHANFIQSGHDGVTGEELRAADVRRLIAEVRDRVAAATGIRLRSEIRHVGFEVAT